ncbi:hypothetical protein AA101099_0757 [Neoasaia chiangmaiensis NBRC 101099]|uniref:Uncharacterized protein n=1 Tax=Neoasaia chiangmaiensis TaxID=320497 RepID=A0A1U9KM78_9PROT|nr:hypothetical protein A0U93_01855 [Neoasaia chiangmaiensis]GBR37516.1 hypothetical protein AA101099_0757 [Neoasaia chiangmaiensis NBRC 101099]GEN14991.1 hypothetical protein NCH01_14220 [Neoasaia chiangmaiensis]
MGRMPGQSDATCVRQQMKYGNGATNGPLPFDGAASRCMRMDLGSPLTASGSHYLPLDLRSDPALQAMAENPAINEAGYPYIPRDSNTPQAGARW